MGAGCNKSGSYEKYGAQVGRVVIPSARVVTEMELDTSSASDDIEMHGLSLCIWRRFNAPTRDKKSYKLVLTAWG